MRSIRQWIPASVRAAWRRLVPRRAPTIAEGWEQYARAYGRRRQGYIGDEWTEPAAMGMDVPPERIVAYLDETVFAPFLGQCHTLLEIGPGGGRFTQILLPKCRKLIAADTSATMLKLLRQRFPDESKMEYLHLDGKGLSPIPDHSVDAVFCYDVFVHLQHWDIYRYLVEIRRVLKPGGKALLQHSNTLSDLGWKLFVSEVPEQIGRPKIPWTFTVMTPQLMEEFVTRAGLRMEKCLTNIARRDGISLIRSPEGGNGPAMR